MSSTPIPDATVADTFFQTPSQFQFSAIDPTQLVGASSKFTLVTLCIDVSASVRAFDKTIEKLLEQIVLACRKDPAADTLMLRVVKFNSSLSEVHGFKLLGSVNVGDYTNSIQCSGSTALYDALGSSIEAAVTYGKTLGQSAYLANAITFVITDGEENASQTLQASDVAKINADVLRSESLESSQLILLGLTDQQSFGTYLETVRKECGCDKAMVIGKFSPGGADVNAGKIAKLVGFVSHSVSSTAQACGTGGPSQSIPGQLTI